MNILFAAAEAAPFIKVGGLGDVAGTLPRYLKDRGHDVRIVLPRYGAIDRDRFGLSAMPGPLGVPMGTSGTLWCEILEGRLPGTDIPVYFLERRDLFDRPGVYDDPSGKGYGDNAFRFLFLSRGALETARRLSFPPRVIHVHDWHTAAVPLYLDALYRGDPLLARSATVLTIHNLEHQGIFPRELMDVLGTGRHYFHTGDLEFYNEVNLLKSGIIHGDAVSTVSPTYAREMTTPAFGCRLDGVIRTYAPDLTGILNGVDYGEWKPEKDPWIFQPYGSDDLSGKGKNKADLQTALGLPVAEGIPVVGMVTRLVHQKGMDVVASVIHRLLDLGIQMVLLGSGESWAHDFFSAVASERPDRFACRLGYDPVLAHRIIAGSDLFLMPSRFEPCGLTQMFALRYGTLPVVRAVGGLNDTVENFDAATGAGTGFKFYDLTGDAVVNTLSWALPVFRESPETLTALRKRAMSRRFSWEDTAGQYELLYRRAAEKRDA